MDRLDSPRDMHTMLLLVDEQGTVIKNLHDPLGKVVVGISEAFDLNSELIMGSFSTPFMSYD